ELGNSQGAADVESEAGLRRRRFFEGLPIKRIRRSIQSRVVQVGEDLALIWRSRASPAIAESRELSVEGSAPAVGVCSAASAASSTTTSATASSATATASAKAAPSAGSARATAATASESAAVVCAEAVIRARRAKAVHPQRITV